MLSRRNFCTHTCLFPYSEARYDLDRYEDFNNCYYTLPLEIEDEDLTSYMCCEKLYLTADNLRKIYDLMFWSGNTFRNFEVENKVLSKHIRHYLNFLCNIWRQTDSITVMDYFMYILPFRTNNLTFFVNLRWKLILKNVQ